MSEAQVKVWEQIHSLGGRFHRADLILFSVPMWNFGIPYRLKHLIDSVTQRGVLFTFDERGLQGLLSGRKAVVMASRGVALGPDYPTEHWDHQVAYLKTWARMVGIYDFHMILNEMTLGGPEIQRENFAQAARAAELIAQQL
jgi:FMN-dependent NADH-azoreductase